MVAMYVAQLSDLGPPNRRQTLPEMAERVSFMEQLNSCIVHAAKLSDFPLNDRTPEFEYYAYGIED